MESGSDAPPTVSLLAGLCLQKVEPSSVPASAWPGVIRLALQHGTAPLLHLRTREQQMPIAARVELSQLYRSNLARNLTLSAEFERVQRAFDRAGVPCQALKGPALAQELYGNVGARQMADLDGLIPEPSLPPAAATLEALGFRRASTTPLAALQKCRDVLFTKEKGNERIYLDLHLRLRPYGKRDALTEILWREGPTDENALLVLCLNILTHRFARLQPWMDLAAYLQLRERPVNWARLQSAATRLEWPGGVFFCLRYASELAGQRVPDCVLRALTPSGWERGWVAALLGRTAAAMLDRSAELDGPRGTLATLFCERGLWPKVRLAGAVLFPPPAALQQMDSPERPLPLPLHYVERAARKLRQATRRAA